MYTKDQQTRSNKIKLSQRQKGQITPATRRQVKERSNGACEICDMARAEEMAHITSRVRIAHKTTANDLIHVCTPCHRWLDGTTDGTEYKKSLSIKKEEAR